jgi:hypothetical protein
MAAVNDRLLLRTQQASLKRAIFQPSGAMKITTDKVGRIAAIVAVVVRWRDEVTAAFPTSDFITPSNRCRQVPHLAA